MTQALRDRLIPWYFVLFFIVVAAVDAVMVTLAVTTHTGTVTDHPYEKGLAYNKVVEAAAAQEKLGWKASLTQASGHIRFTLRDASGSLLTPETLTFRFTRPLQPEMDYETQVPPGGAAAAPQAGLWQILIIARLGSVTYQHQQRLVIP